MARRAAIALKRRAITIVHFVLGSLVLLQASALAQVYGCPAYGQCIAWSTGCPSSCPTAGGNPQIQACCCRPTNSECCEYTCYFYGCWSANSICTQNSVSRTLGGRYSLDCTPNRICQ
jgi:hypothetical protein